jgi:hypothetical protein
MIALNVFPDFLPLSGEVVHSLGLAVGLGYEQD